jgi:hypothetical protein
MFGVTSRLAPPGLAPVAFGLSSALIHLVSIPVTDTSVKPPRSTHPALFLVEAWPPEHAVVLGPADCESHPRRSSLTLPSRYVGTVAPEELAATPARRVEPRKG